MYHNTVGVFNCSPKYGVLPGLSVRLVQSDSAKCPSRLCHSQVDIQSIFLFSPSMSACWPAANRQNAAKAVHTAPNNFCIDFISAQAGAGDLFDLQADCSAVDILRQVKWMKPNRYYIYIYMAMGQHHRLAPKHPFNPTAKIGPKMGDEFSYPKMVPLVLTHSYIYTYITY